MKKPFLTIILTLFGLFSMVQAEVTLQPLRPIQPKDPGTADIRWNFDTLERDLRKIKDNQTYTGSTTFETIYIDSMGKDWTNVGNTIANLGIVNSAVINGATIGTSNITVGAGKTLDVSAGTLTLADNQISGDKVEGGTIAAIGITTLSLGSMETNWTNAGRTIADLGVVTTADINGGTIDGASIGASSASTGKFTTALVGADANFTDFSDASAVISNGNTGRTQDGTVGLAVETVGGAGKTGFGVYAYAIGSDATHGGRGVVGYGAPSATGDTATSYGVLGYASVTHAGGPNIAVYGDAQNGATNYSFYGANGLIYNPGGINFASADSTLANYKEGTFTPTVAVAGGGTAPVYSTKTGRYTRIGNRCFVDIILTGDGGAEGAGAGALTITNLPFTVNASSFNNYTPSGYFQNGTLHMVGLVCPVAGGTTLSLYYMNAIGTVALLSGNLQNNTTRRISIQCWYEI